MIHIRIFEDEAGEIKGFLVEGHAGYAPRGQDIVCAGISALVQAAVLGLREFLTRPPQVEAGPEETNRLFKTGKSRTPGIAPKSARGKRGNVFLKVMLPDSLGERDREVAKIILETLEMGLRGIALGYHRYVEIRRCRGHDEV